MAGAGLTHNLVGSEYANRLTRRPLTPARLVVTVDKEFQFDLYRHDYSSGGKDYYQIYTYTNPHLIPMPPPVDAADDPCDVVRISGSGFEHSFSGATDTSTSDSNFTGSQSWQGMQLLIWCYYDENINTYEITTEGALPTSRIKRVRTGCSTSMWA